MNDWKMPLILLFGIWQSHTSAAGVVTNLRQEHYAWRSRIMSVRFSATLSETAESSGSQRLSRHDVAILENNRSVEAKHSIPPFDWADDLAWAHTVISGDKVQVHWILNRTLERSEVESTTAHHEKLRPFWNEPLLMCSGWWPTTTLCEIRVSKRTALPVPANAVHRVLAQPSLKLISEAAIIDNRTCIQVRNEDEHYTDDLWFDAKRPGALLRREQLNKSTGISMVVENFSFTEVLPRTWLPLKSTCTQTRDGKVLAGFRRRTEWIGINCVEKSDFEIPLLPGMLIVDRDDGLRKYSVIPGGREVLTALSKLAGKLAKASGAADEDVHGPLRLAFAGLCGVVLFGFVFFYFDGHRSMQSNEP